MKALITITRRGDIADPQGATIARALDDLGFADVSAVRVNRTVEVSMPGLGADQVMEAARAMCEKMLANPVMEDFEIEVIE